jgi:hypothetical protein
MTWLQDIGAVAALIVIAIVIAILLKDIYLR